MWEFHQIYNLGAVGDKNELIRFRSQKVTHRSNMVKNHLLKMHLSSEGILVNEDILVSEGLLVSDGIGQRGKTFVTNKI